MGRHGGNTPARSRTRHRRGWIIAAVVVVGLVVGGGIAWTQNVFDPLLPAAAWAQTCTPTELTVVADPTIEPALKKSAVGFDAVTPCVKTTVRSQKSADTASTLAVGGDPKADVWIPDSPAWEPREDVTSWSLIRRAPLVQFGEPIAWSPLVFAAPAQDANQLGKTKLGWGSVYGNDVTTLLPEPAQNGSSLTALAEIKAAAPSSDPLAYDRAMIGLGKDVPSTIGDAFTAAEKNNSSVVITTEQSVVSQNETQPSHQFFAMYPTDGTVRQSYPFVRVAGPTSGDPAKDALIDKLESQFSTDSHSLAEAGFRTEHGNADFAAKGVIANAPAAQEPLDGGAQVSLLQDWSAITVRSRMLVAVDVSGSMNEDAGNGLTRIGVFQQAALGVVQMLPPQSQLGLWDFSTNQVGSQPWKPLTPIASISDPAHAADIAGIVASIPALVQGDTGLYDTVLAAVTEVRANYNPKMVNSVLVITDGRNDNPGGGLSLPDLLQKLKAGDDPNRPVPVILVGLGPDTDVAAMSQIANATVGAAYTAEQPADLGTVLVDALSQRTCRPYCA